MLNMISFSWWTTLLIHFTPNNADFNFFCSFILFALNYSIRWRKGIVYISDISKCWHDSYFSWFLNIQYLLLWELRHWGNVLISQKIFTITRAGVTHCSRYVISCLDHYRASTDHFLLGEAYINNELSILIPLERSSQDPAASLTDSVAELTGLWTQLCRHKCRHPTNEGLCKQSFFICREPEATELRRLASLSWEHETGLNHLSPWHFGTTVPTWSQHTSGGVIWSSTRHSGCIL